MDNTVFWFICSLLKCFFSRWVLKQGWDVFVVWWIILVFGGVFCVCVYTCQAPHLKRSPKARVRSLPFTVWWIILVLVYMYTSQAPRLKRSPKTKMSCLHFAVWWIIHVFSFICYLVMGLSSRWALRASQWQPHSAILCFWGNTLHSSCMRLWMSDCRFMQCVSKYLSVALNEWLEIYTACFWISTDVVTALFACYVAGATWNCCHLGALSMDTIQQCTSLQCHFIWSHIHRVCVCVWLAVSCHLHF